MRLGTPVARCYLGSRRDRDGEGGGNNVAFCLLDGDPLFVFLLLEDDDELLLLLPIRRSPFMDVVLLILDIAELINPGFDDGDELGESDEDLAKIVVVPSFWFFQEHCCSWETIWPVAWAMIAHFRALLPCATDSWCDNSSGDAGGCCCLLLRCLCRCSS